MPQALRLTEPRLSGFDDWRPCTKSRPDDHVVETFDCGPTNPPTDLVSLAVSECDDKMNTATEAVRLLAYVPQCTDAAVERLETLAKPRSDARLMNDLAGAYYVRAQRKDQPSDFVRSLDSADRVVDLAPTMAEGRFNRALALEALGFETDAIDAWDALRKDTSSPWSNEAGEHYERLVSQRSRTAAVRWPLNEERLPMVAREGDRKAVQQLVSPYRSAAQTYVEEVVLPAWTEASMKGRAGEAAEQLELAEMIASALARLMQDRYLLDAVARIRSNRDPRVLKQLEDGHRLFDIARHLGGGSRNDLRAAAYERAERALAAAGSPLRFGAMLGRVAALTQDAHYDEALVLLRFIERAADEHQYPSLLARVHTGRGYLMLVQERDLDALAEYSEAQSIFKHIGDAEKVGSMQDYIGGLFRRIGHKEFTWRAAFQAQRYAEDLVDVQARHVHLGENALSAIELGYPSVALRYQNLAVTLLENEMSRSADQDVNDLRHNRGVALRTRAGIHVYLGDRKAAQADLAASTPLLREAVGRNNLSIPLGFRAQLLETEARRLAGTDRRQAIKALSEGIRLASETYYRSLVASLRIQRAELYRSEGNRAAAADDLQTAIAILRAEERSALEPRKDRKTPDADELLWSAYFSRSQEAYRRLIEIYADENAEAEAFEYAEKARGYEPLHRILQRGDLPSAFRDRIRDDEPLRLADVQQFLPAGTFLLEYSVHDDKTYVWIVGPNVSERQTLRVGENTIKEWMRSLQRFAALRDSKRFEESLTAPYKALLEEPLAIVAKLQSQNATSKIVIVPDRSMHGLPFAALRNGNRHLIQDHAVAVAGSATLYAFSLAQDRQLSRQKGQSVLLFADPEFDQSLDVARDLKRLVAARSEAVQIRSVYASVARVVPPLMDHDATVPAFLRLAAESTIVHLAAHGVANPDVPSRSFLLLAPTGDDRGAIDAERLSKQLHLTKTRLVVLSACSSAGGTPVGPEGLSPLVRPLIVAGVPGVVGTLWNVSDSLATEDLLVRFHQYYRDGHDADDALRRAQLDMLARTEVGHRAVWGWSAFQMIGYASSPFRASADETRRTQ